jgi:hypothetical protein
MDKIGVNNLVNKYFDSYDKNKDKKIELKKENKEDKFDLPESFYVDMQYSTSDKKDVTVTKTDMSKLFSKANLNNDNVLTKEELTSFIKTNYDKGDKGYLSGSTTSKIPFIRMFFDSKDGEIDKLNEDFKPEITSEKFNINDIPKNKVKNIRNFRSEG